jgi:hypothetical protein
MLKFDDSLSANPNRPLLHGLQQGPCAMGPVNDGDTLLSMEVWVFQEGRDRAAFASGSSRGDDGEFDSFTGRWMVRTGVHPGSDPFVAGVPALAMATAVVEHADGGRDVEQWTQAVGIHVDDD